MFIKTEYGYLNLNKVQELFAFGNDEGGEIVAFLSTPDPDDDGEDADIVLVAETCCQETAQRSLDRLMGNVALGRPLEDYLDLGCGGDDRPNLHIAYAKEEN